MGLIKRIEDMGGMLEAIKKGWVDQEIDEALTRYQDQVENREKIVVGMNEFTIPPEEDTQIDFLKISYERGIRRIDEVKRLKRERDNSKVEHSIKKLYRATKGKENIMPYVIDAIMNYATIGEIVGTVRVAYGNSYDPSETLNPHISFE